MELRGKAPKAVMASAAAVVAFFANNAFDSLRHVSPASADAADALSAPITKYNLMAAYPNLEMVKAGLMLQGINQYDANVGGPNEAVLWDELEPNGAFLQYNSSPTDPNAKCHYDELAWSARPNGTLTYLGTRDECNTQSTEIRFYPGLNFMPKTWTPGQKWEQSGTSLTLYYENDVLVCRGINTWHSKILGLSKLNPHNQSVRTQTNETQTLTAVAGAPQSEACPVNVGGKFNWQENFWIGQVPTKGGNNSSTTWVPGLQRTMGGNVEQTKKDGHPAWDATFYSYQPTSQETSY